MNDADYQPPFNFTGELNEMTVNLGLTSLAASDSKKGTDTEHKRN